jgi:hypothetical protein
VRRGRPDREDDGETVIRAVVHARLLGLRILSLDARVVVGQPPAPFTAFDPDTTVPATAERFRSSPPGAPRSLHRDMASAPDLSRAVELLAYGAETLERSRRFTDRSAARRRVSGPECQGGASKLRNAL